MTECCVNIALPGTYFDAFTYIWPFKTQPILGMRVKVPFKRSFKIGVIIEAQVIPNINPQKLKKILEIIDSEPVIFEELIQLALWVAKYYYIAKSEIFLLLFPTLERQAKPLVLKKNESWCDVGVGTESPNKLNAEQNDCVNAINACHGKFNCFLLCGVTGSGKTEVYLHIMANILAKGQQVLILLPEIALMSQWVERFSKRFKYPYVVMHSGLPERARQKAWHAVLNNHAMVVLGSRSSVLAPCKNLGLIIVDEEHDQALRQHEKFHYSARDVAIKRAKNSNIPIILGSATPSLQSYHHALTEKYKFLQLPNRVVATNPLKIIIENTRASKPKYGLTAKSLAAIKAHLQQDNQILIFLNRRGFAPILYCYQCGWMIDCVNCTTHLTWHKKKQLLVCHHCGYQKKADHTCPNNHQNSMVPVGIGTQRLEDYLIESFPSYGIVRIDRDEVSSSKTRQQQFNKIFSKEAKIIIGTQMMAKGHHFPDLTLVVIVDVDQGLYHPDYRATEQLGQLISQVAGRAGREHKAGEVILQTAFPQHPALNVLLKEGYLVFLKQLLQDRRLAALPPFSYIALINAEASKINLAMSGLGKLKFFLQQQHVDDNLSLLGPAPALLAKKANKFRAKLLLKSSSRAALHHNLHIIRNFINTSKGSIKYLIEVDPDCII